MPLSPKKLEGSQAYEEGWRAVNELIRADGSWSGRERNVCYRNLGEGAFEDASYVSGLDFPDDGRAWVALDLDSDGDLDLVLKSRTGPQVRVLRNDTPADRAFTLELLTTPGRHAIGAVATMATSRGRRLTRHVRAGSGFLSEPSRRLHFALAEGETPASLEIRWPGAPAQTIRAIPSGRALRLKQGSAAIEALDLPRPAPADAPAEPMVERPWLVEPLALSDPQLRPFRGKKLLVSLWASWCPPCRKELEDFTARAAEFSQAGVQVAILPVEETPAPPEHPFARLSGDQRTIGVYSILFRNLFDRRRDLVLPLSLLVDEDGRLLKFYQGPAAVEEVIADARGAARPALPFAGLRVGAAPERNFNDVATALAERGFSPEAAALFDTAISRGRAGYETYNNYAGLLVAEGKLAEAEKLLRTSIRANPSQAGSNANLGLLLMETRPAEAAPYLEKALALQPDSARVRRALSALYNDAGIGHMEAGRAAEGLRSFEKAAAVDPSDPAAQVNLALYWVQAGDTAKARAILEKLLALNPGHAPALDLLRRLRQ